MTFKSNRRRWLGVAAALTLGVSALGWAPVTQAADDWPERAVNLVVPFPAGGPVDTAARFVAKPLAEKWGEPAVIDNRAGAGGIVAARYVVNEKPDGYTFLLPAIHHAILPSLRDDLGYDIQADFEPIGSVARFPIVLVVNSSFEVDSVQELIDYAREHPGAVTYASSGIGGGTHLAGELFGKMAGVEMHHIPYRGSAPAIQDVASGQVQVMFADAPSALSFLDNGNIRALAVGNPERSELLPDLPTIDEGGVPGYEAYSWSALLAPKGTPQDIIEQVSADLQEALSDPEIGPLMAAAGAEPMLSTPEEFAEFLDDEINKWGQIIREANIEVE
ncbi:MAG TPA: tripartite tricarboxylate transporter substrate binding protein [Paenalcaligenes sp.]|nr:tripartite tricarboxylate transporter substrate binding protein [Paenalcaligenes sp.]